MTVDSYLQAAETLLSRGSDGVFTLTHTHMARTFLTFNRLVGPITLSTPLQAVC